VEPITAASSPPSPPIVEVSKVSYRGAIIRIFADAGVKNHSRFFFEPLVHLDPKTIFARHYSFFQYDVVSFTIEMWNIELRRKVFDRVKSLKGQNFNVTNIGEEDIYVLPFEEVFLIHEFHSTTVEPSAVKVIDGLQSYVRQSENLQFNLLCNSTSTAKNFAEDFRLNPGLVLHNFNMGLAANELVLGNQLEKNNSTNYKYPISTFNSTWGSQKQGKFISYFQEL